MRGRGDSNSTKFTCVLGTCHMLRVLSLYYCATTRVVDTSRTCVGRGGGESGFLTISYSGSVVSLFISTFSSTKCVSFPISSGSAASSFSRTSSTLSLVRFVSASGSS